MLGKGMKIPLPLWFVIIVAISQDLFQGYGWFVERAPVCEGWFYGWLAWTGVLMAFLLVAEKRYFGDLRRKEAGANEG